MALTLESSAFSQFFDQQIITQERVKIDHDYKSNKVYEDPPGMTQLRVLGKANKESSDGIKFPSKRPPRLVVPQFFCDEICDNNSKLEIEVEGTHFCVASKKGRRREFMEDAYSFLLDNYGDSNQAYFAVIDGHGGRDAADYVAENLGNNISECLKTENDYRSEDAIRRGYLLTDQAFLNQGLSSGACVASVVIKDRKLHVANVGDCKVVLCRNGVANTLTDHHRLTRQDERLRIQNSGGFVYCKNGVWRVEGTLSVSRAIGDKHLKKWVISEPDIITLPLTPNCQFLIIASDGLWDKVSSEEAVELIKRENGKGNVCKKLVEMSSSRGNMDDITVMLVNLQTFLPKP